MADPSAKQRPPHEFPVWPFSWMTLYSHAVRDFERCGEALTHATDPLQAVNAEGDLGLRLWQDAMQAYCDLAVLPLTLAAKAVASASAAPDAADVKPAAE